jgi:hypothetical protein
VKRVRIAAFWFDRWKFQSICRIWYSVWSPSDLLLLLSPIFILFFKLKGEMFPGLENRDYGRGGPLRWPRDTLYQLKLALTSPTGCGRSVGIVRLRTKTTEFSLRGDVLLLADWWARVHVNIYRSSPDRPWVNNCSQNDGMAILPIFRTRSLIY